MRREKRSSGVARRSDKTLTDLALMFNQKLHGWINYYRRFYKSSHPRWTSQRRWRGSTKCSTQRKRSHPARLLLYG
jgi:hypothetical protein